MKDLVKMSGIVGLIIGIALAAIVTASILPTAISNINSANTTAWSTAEVAVWGLLTLVIVLSILLAFFKYVRA